MGFNLDNYEPVEERLARFWKDHPGGRVITDLLDTRADGEFVVKALVYRHSDEPQPAATGYAHEVVGQGTVNKTSALENCETSAIGRALANLGYAPKGQRASREEMTKTVENRPTQSPQSHETPAPKATVPAKPEPQPAQRQEPEVPIADRPLIINLRKEIKLMDPQQRHIKFDDLPHFTLQQLQGIRDDLKKAPAGA